MNERKCMKCILSNGNSGISEEVENILAVTSLKMLRSNGGDFKVAVFLGMITCLSKCRMNTRFSV